MAAGRSRPPYLAIVGPTASGKTEASLTVAKSLDAEIVSVDSMLVYRGLDIGTAKPTLEQRARAPHHLIDVADPQEAFTVAMFQRMAAEAVDGIRARGRTPLLVGGSGLYFRAIVDELHFPGTDPATRADLELEAASIGAERLHERLARADPRAAETIEPGNVRRTIRALEVASITGRPFSSYAQAWEEYPPGRVRAAGIELDRAELDRRARARVQEMIEAGFAGEVRGLVERGLGEWLTSSQAIGYAELARHLQGELPFEEAIEGIVRRTRNLARRQLAWFRRDPRIRWFAAHERGAPVLAAHERGAPVLAAELGDYLSA